MSLTIDGGSVNSSIGTDQETFTAQDVFAAKRKGEMIARQESRETIEILQHNLKTALLALDGAKLEPWQREILDKSAGGVHGNGKDVTCNSSGSCAGCTRFDVKRETGV